VTPEELARRLDGRSHSWLADYLGIHRANVWLWLDRQRPIPEKYHQKIRDRLPLATPDTDRELFFRTGYMTAVRNMREAVSAVASLVDKEG
jgi:hypothetical protein